MRSRDPSRALGEFVAWTMFYDYTFTKIQAFNFLSGGREINHISFSVQQSPPGPCPDKVWIVPFLCCVFT